MKAVRQYLERYAAAEAGLAQLLPQRYAAALIVPAFREPPGLLAGYAAALESAPGRVLVIVVVNAPASDAGPSWALHRELIADLCGRSAQQLGGQPCWLARQAAADVLVLDRAQPGRCFPDGQGVGLARRIGCDLALALYAAQQLDDPYLYCTDADAVLPAGYFCVAPRAPQIAGLTFDFWHEPGADAAITAATAIYELGLRYYVEGLASAGSPYALHTIGSTLAVRAECYAAVRGFPRRLAGEDFYLLNKLAKVGALLRIDAARVRLSSRASLRTPHGTGVAAREIAARTDPEGAPLYHPGSFAVLGAWLRALAQFARQRQLAAARAELLSAVGAAHVALDQTLDELGAWPALEQAAARCRGEAELSFRLHTWFDAFRTLKLVHGLRQRGWASLPLRSALEASRWVSVEQAQHASIDELRHLLAACEARRGALRGPWQARSARRSAPPENAPVLGSDPE